MTTKNKSEGKSENKPKCIGAKPIINSNEPAPPSIEYNSLGIHTKYNAFGGYSGPTRAQGRFSRLIEQQKLDRPKEEKIGQKLALLFLNEDIKKQWQKDITECFQAKVAYEKRKAAGEDIETKDDPIPSELLAYNPVKHRQAFKTILAVFHKRKYQGFNTVIDKDISSIYPDFGKKHYPLWFIEQALHIVEMAEAEKSVKPENQATQINSGTENKTDKKINKSEITSIKRTRETYFQTEKDFRAWLETTPVFGQKSTFVRSILNESIKNRTDVVGLLLQIFSPGRFLPLYWERYGLPDLAKEFAELDMNNRIMTLKRTLMKTECNQLIERVNKVFLAWTTWLSEATKRGLGRTRSHPKTLRSRMTIQPS